MRQGAAAATNFFIRYSLSTSDYVTDYNFLYMQFYSATNKWIYGIKFYGAFNVSKAH
jgi:hypothetical protein